VIRKGLLQQADTPQYLYDHPVNLFVAGFIGSPAMNMVEATLSNSNGTLTLEFGGFRLGIPSDVESARPGLRAFEGKSLILGVRPEDMEDAALGSDAPNDRRIRSTVELREALGSDVVIHFKVKAPIVVTEDVRELADDVGQEALEAVEQEAAQGESTFVARLNPRTKATQGEPIELVVDVSRLHFFDPDTGLGIYEGGR
jgi:multiple sugar transport system ATP-binding protein